MDFERKKAMMWEEKIEYCGYTARLGSESDDGIAHIRWKPRNLEIKSSLSQRHTDNCQLTPL